MTITNANPTGYTAFFENSHPDTDEDGVHIRITSDDSDAFALAATNTNPLGYAAFFGGKVRSGGKLFADGDCDVAGHLWVGGDFSVSGDFTVGGNSTFDDVTMDTVSADKMCADLFCGGSFTGDDLKIGTEDLPTGYIASFDGKVICEELKVEISGTWPDYVFADDYQLPTLKEVEASINKNQHLPGVPSASEVSEKGLMVGEMQKILMEKVEELTLYTIAQQKQIDRLLAHNERLQIILDAQMNR